MKKADKKELLIKVHKRFKIMLDADDRNRRDALDDMSFIHVPDGRENGVSNSGQWDQNMLKERGKRPAYVFNKLRVTMKRIINDIRANTPSAKVRGTEGGDVKTAEIFEGLIRNIWGTSNGDTIVDGAAQYMVSAGMGAWKLTFDFPSSTAFEQTIKVEEILNPFCLFSDPSDKTATKEKARDWILTDKMASTAFKAQYPDAEKIDFESHEFDDNEEWYDSGEDEVRIAEYWYKIPVQKELWQLQDGKVVDAGSDEAAGIDPSLIKRTRIVDTDQIMMCVVSGDSILEGPTEWPGTMFPFVVVYGEHFVVDGRVYWYGAGRWAKDAQRSYNVSRTAITETIAQAPQAKWWVTTVQSEGHTDNWKDAHVENFPFLGYNPDPLAPGPPQRMGTSDVPVALIQESQLASEEINMTTGRYQNDVGAPNAASSGKQEAIRNAQGDLATYNYPDNMGKAIQRTWALLIDLIPKVYNTERELRILGADGTEDYKTINTFAYVDGVEKKINDLSVGAYDTTITIGPSFSTRRQEASEAYQQLVQGNPAIWGVAGDLIFKSMDLPYADEIAERLRSMLPPQIQNMLNEEKDVPPEVQQMMQQAQQAMQMVQQQAQELQQKAAEVQKDATANEQTKAEIEKLIAQLETKQAQFQAKIAQDFAKVAEKDSRLTIEKVQYEADGTLEVSRQAATENIAQFQQALAQDTAQVLSEIQAIAQGLSKQAVDALGAIREEKDCKPRIKKITSKRVNGKLETDKIIYEDEPTIN